MILYETGTTNFTKNGLGYINDVLNAKVTDELNGEYSLYFEYPTTGIMANELIEGRIVKCKVSDGTKQCFLIKKITKTYDKMTINCSHLFYLLLDDFAEDLYPQNLSPKLFLEWIIARANYQLPFTVTSDVATVKSARYIRKNLVEVILGEQDNSIINLFGVEVKRNNFNIALNARLGADRGEKLLYGKNITGINITTDSTEVFTRIMPMGFDGLLLPEKYIDATNINDFPYPKIGLFEFPDIRYDPDDSTAYQNINDAYNALRDAVAELYQKGINIPRVNVKINWLELSKTEEYKQYSTLERVELGDTVHAEIFGLNYTTRVIKTIYNPLTDRIEGFEIGTVRPTLTTQINYFEKELEQVNPTSILEKAQSNATGLITQAMGGYVYKTNSELYIMDNPNPNQAVKVWRWNINGLGYSNTGINGTYNLAMTMDGSIVADFITTGTLTTSVIQGYDSLILTVNSKVGNNEIISKINQTSEQITIDANKVNLTGYVTATNLSTSGQTTINGDNITTGVIKSSNYVANTSGTKLDLSNGNAEINNGRLQIQTGMQETNPTDFKIKLYNTSTLYNSKFFADGFIISNNDNINEPRTIVGPSSIASWKGDYFNVGGYGTYLSPYYIRAIDTTSSIPSSKQSKIEASNISTPQLFINGVDPFEVTTGSSVVSRTSGATLDSSSYAKYGKVCQLEINITTTSSTSSGNNVFVGSVSSGYRPRLAINSATYNGSVGMVCYIATDGTLTVRVISGTLASGKTQTIGFTYIL